MTEDDARHWTIEHYGAAVADRLGCFATMVVEENARQNLISPASVGSMWSRHIVDSLQLTLLADAAGPWLDVGTGGGFPGMIVAIATRGETLLVEPRKRRASFLAEAAEALGLTNVAVAPVKVEQVTGRFATISARAVASVENLLRVAWHCATPETRWLLPRGTVNPADAEAARHRGMMFHVEQSLTNAESSIVVLTAR